MLGGSAQSATVVHQQSLTPSPRRLDVVAKANNAAVRPHKLEGLPESMLSRADVSYSGSHHAHNFADNA